MIALLDGDLFLYRIGFVTQEESEGIARARMDTLIEGILEDTGATEYQLWLSDSTVNNFRTKYYPEYKANRKNFVKPVHYEMLKAYVIEEWGARITPNEEADDRLGIEQCSLNNPEYEMDFNLGDKPTWLRPCETHSIIVTIDKDLDQIPGNHYNFVKGEKYFITPAQGLRFFYHQLLTGDTSDNIQGCPGIGPAKADKRLAGICSEEGLFDSVVSGYRDAYKKVFQSKELTEHQSSFVNNEILKNGICLHIRQEESTVWTFPKSSQITEHQSLSTPPMQVVNTLSTEPINLATESGSQ